MFSLGAALLVAPSVIPNLLRVLPFGGNLSVDPTGGTSGVSRPCVVAAIAATVKPLPRVEAVAVAVVAGVVVEVADVVVEAVAAAVAAARALTDPFALEPGGIVKLQARSGKVVGLQVAAVAHSADLNDSVASWSSPPLPFSFPLVCRVWSTAARVDVSGLAASAVADALDASAVDTKSFSFGLANWFSRRRRLGWPDPVPTAKDAAPDEGETVFPRASRVDVPADLVWRRYWFIARMVRW